MSVVDHRGVRLEPIAGGLVFRCRCCGGPMPEERLKSRTRWCSRRCTVWMADLYRKERNLDRHGVTRPDHRSKA